MKNFYKLVWVATLLSLTGATFFDDDDDFMGDLFKDKDDLDTAPSPFNTQAVSPFEGFGGNKGLFKFNFAETMESLSHLGDRIRKEMEESMKPLRAKEIYTSMSRGVGGRSIYVFTHPKPMKLMAERGEMLVCQNGIIDDSDKCDSPISFLAKDRLDYCFSRRFAVVTNNICIADSFGGSFSISYVNNNMECSTGSAKKPMIISRREYRKMCGRGPDDVDIIYYPQLGNPMAIKIPNPNSLVQCKMTAGGGCKFSGKDIFGTIIDHMVMSNNVFNFGK